MRPDSAVKDGGSKDRKLWFLRASFWPQTASLQAPYVKDKHTFMCLNNFSQLAINQAKHISD